MRSATRMKRFCLFLVLGSAFLTIGASAAHAAEAEWKIGGKTFAELGIKEAAVLASASESFVFTIPWYATEVSCTTLSIESGKLLTAGASSGTLVLSGCSLKGPPFVAETCKLIEPISLKIKDKLITHAERAYDLFEAAETGKALGNVQFKEGTECPLPLTNELKGSFVAETESGQRVKQPFTFSSALEKLFTSDKLTFGTHPMELEGKATLDLGSPNEGKEWSAEPEKIVKSEKEFRIEGKTLTEKGISSETIEFSIAAGKLLVPGLVLTFKCTVGVGSGTVLLGGTLHATILFSGCEVEGNKFCKIYETKAKMETELEANRGFIVASGLGENLLMGGKHYILVSSGATPFTTIYLTKSAKGCTLSLEEPVSGSTVFFAPNALTPLVNQTLSTMPQAELEALFPSDIFKYGNQTGWLDEGGTTNAVLSGTNIGRTWGAE